MPRPLTKEGPLPKARESGGQRAVHWTAHAELAEHGRDIQQHAAPRSWPSRAGPVIKRRRGRVRTSEAARYARWSVTVAAAIAALTFSVYLYRAWEARQERRRAPAPALPGVERQSSALAFSKVEKKQTIFTVRASRSTEFSANGENLLEDVQITIFGRDGNRHDSLLTRSCEYQKDSGNIRCGGKVKMELESAQDVGRTDASARRARVETSNVTFERDSGLAQTSEPVTFALPRCHGQALGATYDSDSGVLRLARLPPVDLLEGGRHGCGRPLVVGPHLAGRQSRQRQRRRDPGEPRAHHSPGCGAATPGALRRQSRWHQRRNRSR